MQLRHFERPGVILMNLENGQYAASLAGVRDLRYFSIGQRGQAPYIDMAYALGGFWYYPPTRQVYWCVLDKQLGCALISCDDTGQASVIYSERLPACFQIAGGEETTGCLLLRKGIIDQGWFRARDHIIVDPSSLRGSGIEAHQIGRHLLPSPFIPTPSLPREGQVIGGTTAGEFQLGADQPYIARMALSEGEASELSLWIKARDLLRRIAPSLRSVESWTWLAHRGKPVVIASTGVYANTPSIVVWRTSQSGWEVVKRFSGYAFVRIIRVDAKGSLIYEAAKNLKTQDRGVIKVF
ncbi:hypothetical protein HRbin15_01699 [bacterium HR15]|nr:hypothetical protein HRbin15_01699 [bacterium HR15]